jgi:two-component system NtrC family sensor kinase
MKISTRLILLLTTSVSIVMLIASLISLQQKEARLLAAARDVSRAHALTLKIALEEDYVTGRSLDARRLISRLRENTGVISVLLFNEKGELSAISNDLVPDDVRYLKEARQVIETGAQIEIERRLGGEDYFSIIMPLQFADSTAARQAAAPHPLGAIEIIQPISFVSTHIGRARLHLVITALLLGLTILIVVAIVTRFSLSDPIKELLEGAMAVGRGNFDYRVPVSQQGTELATLAREFNRMADRLAEQRMTLKREAEERISLERQLRHTERLAAIGHLAAGVAHEMGAPLQVIDGRAKQLQQQPEAQLETRQRNLTIIRSQAARITRIVRQLLNLSRPFTLNPQLFEVEQLLRDTSELLESQAEKAYVRLHAPRADGRGHRISADPELIHQVILNICQNGIQAMPEGGELTLDCATWRADQDSRQYVAIRISDTGTGISSENMGRIFDPFFTTKEVGSGTGLGLAVSRRIVEEHLGWMEAANRPGGGATFTVYLPLVSDPHTQPETGVTAGKGASNE